MLQHLLSILLNFASISVASADLGPRETILQRLEPHAAKLAARYTKIRFMETTRTPRGGEEEQIMTTKGMFDLDHYLVWVEEDKVVDLKKKKSTRRIPGHMGRNPFYQFTLNDKSEGLFVLKNFQLFSETPDRNLIWLSFPIAFPDWGRTYLDILRDPETVVHEAQEAVWNDQMVFKVDMEASYEFRGKKDRARMRLYFAPESGWVCVGKELQELANADSPHVREVFSYDTSREWARPTRRELWLVNPKDASAKQLIRATDIAEFTPITDWDESKFRLSAFGLPEPAGMKWPQPMPSYLWFLVAAGGLAVLALGFRWLGQRRIPSKGSSQGVV